MYQMVLNAMKIKRDGGGVNVIILNRTVVCEGFLAFITSKRR